MTKRNIHGDWTMNFEGRISRSTIMGSTNNEAAINWSKDVRNLVQSSEEGTNSPWLMLNDCRDWNMASMDAWDTNNQIIDWSVEHQCILVAAVLSKKLQEYAFTTGFRNQGVLQFFTIMMKLHEYA